MNMCFCIGDLSDAAMTIVWGRSAVWLRKDDLNENDEDIYMSFDCN